jgi:DNA-binding MarR family transcriptional regulator
MSELARLEDLNPTMLSRVIAGMATRGLIERAQHPGDGRAIIVRATPAGEALRDEALRARTSVLARELERLTPAEAAAVEEALPVLERLVERLKEHGT